MMTPPMTEPLTVFTIPTGTRVRVKTAALGVGHEDAMALKNAEITFEATAAGTFKKLSGTRHRLFTDVEPPVAGIFDWMYLPDNEVGDDFQIIKSAPAPEAQPRPKLDAD